jgi:hypothetical protein
MSTDRPAHDLEEVAYRLSWDVDYFERFGIDGRDELLFNPFDGYARSAFFDPEPFAHPDPVVYSGYFPTLTFIDYPLTDNGWCVTSRRMYEVLRSVGDFPHRVIPVAVADTQRPRSERAYANGKLNSSFHLWNYLAVHIDRHLDLFDETRAVFTRDSALDIVDIEQYAFQIPAGGLPPLFRVSVDPTTLFISHPARVALRAARISGPRYISLAGFRGGVGDVVDVPVDLTPLVR